MLHFKNIIQVFEYNSLQYGTEYNGVLFKESHFNALVKFNELHQNRYFNIGYKKITFKNYVGVLQVDGLVIEILPKIDQYETNTVLWQSVLIQMLKVTKKLKVNAVGEAQIKKQNIHLLDIYFEWFLNEVELLIRQGLIKQYYKETKNIRVLKGKLEFSRHLSKNLVHKERFYTSHQVYEKDHLIHQVIGQALEIVASMSKGNHLYHHCKSVQLDFPEVTSIQATHHTFNKIPKTRKTAPYETVLAIARLIILNYAPNVASGNENMLALLFDMNRLWEEYVLVRLQQVAEEKGVEVYGQNSKGFWDGITIRPDIVLVKKNYENREEFLIIDTKWKNIDYAEPSIHDLRQMYVYNEFWKSTRSLLLYPSMSTHLHSDHFISYEDHKHSCCLGKISIFKEEELDVSLGEEIIKLFKSNEPHQSNIQTQKMP